MREKAWELSAVSSSSLVGIEEGVFKDLHIEEAHQPVQAGKGTTSNNSFGPHKKKDPIESYAVWF